MVREYVPVFLRYMILLAIAMGGIIYLERKVGALINATSFVGAFAYCLLIGGMVLFLLMILFMCFDKNFRYFIIHIRGYVSLNMNYQLMLGREQEIISICIPLTRH